MSHDCSKGKSTSEMLTKGGGKETCTLPTKHTFHTMPCSCRSHSQTFLILKLKTLVDLSQESVDGQGSTSMLCNWPQNLMMIGTNRYLWKYPCTHLTITNHSWPNAPHWIRLYGWWTVVIPQVQQWSLTHGMFLLNQSKHAVHHVLSWGNAGSENGRLSCHPLKTVLALL